MLFRSLSGVSLGMSWERLGKQILSLFTVSALSVVSLGMSWERLGKQILSLFTNANAAATWMRWEVQNYE